MGLRASDDDRERVVDFLRRQQGLGRLTLDELEERSAAAWAAVEVADLDRLMADLPSPPVTPPMLAYGFEITERTPERLVFDYSRTPAWVALPCVFLFPVGLLALLIKTHNRVTVELADRGGETLLVAHGVAPLSVRRAFAELED